MLIILGIILVIAIAAGIPSIIFLYNYKPKTKLSPSKYKTMIELAESRRIKEIEAAKTEDDIDQALEKEKQFISQYKLSRRY